LWETVNGGIVRVPPCGPLVAGGALYFVDDGGSQLALTRVLDLLSIRFVITLHCECIVVKIV